MLLYAQEDVERQFGLSARSRLSAAEIQAVLRALRRLGRKKRTDEPIIATAGEVLAEDGSKRWRAEGMIEGRPTVFDADVLGDALAEDVAIERAYDLEGILPPDYAPDGVDEDEA